MSPKQHLLFGFVLLVGYGDATLAEQWNHIGPDGFSATWMAADPGSDNVLVTTDQRGIYRSADGGQSWQVSVDSINGNSMTVGQWNARATGVATTFWAAKQSNVFRSDDGGVTFDEVLNSPVLFPSAVVTLAASNESPSRLYVVLLDRTVMRSDDGGVTWTATNSSVPAGVPLELLVDPTDGDLLFLSTRSNGVFRSDDAGDSWVPINSGLASTSILDLALGGAGPMGRTLYVTAGLVLYQSVDSGDSWSERTVDAGQGPVIVNAVHAVDLNPDLILAGNLSALYESTDNGATWFMHDGGDFSGAQFIYASSTSPSRWFANGYGNPVARSSDAGSTWSDVGQGITGAYSSAFPVTPIGRPNTFWTVRGDILMRSDDGGLNWLPIHQLSGEDAVLESHPSNPDVLYVCEFSVGLSRTLDNGQSFTQIADTSVIGFDMPWSIAISEIDPQHMLLHVGNRLIVTFDGGATWTPQTFPFVDGSQATTVISPANDSRAYYVSGDEVWVSDDGGVNWVQSASMPFGTSVSAQASPFIQDKIYVANGSQIAISDNAGVDWSFATVAPGFSPRSINENPMQESHLVTTGEGLGGEMETHHSYDGGQTWAKLAANAPFNLSIRFARNRSFGLVGWNYGVEQLVISSIFSDQLESPFP